MNRREFLKMLGVSATTFVAFPRAIWTPRTECYVGAHWDVMIMDDIVSDVNHRALLIEIMKNVVPMDTLFLSQFVNVPASDIRHEWLVDGLE